MEDHTEPPSRSADSARRLRFGPFEVDAERRVLRRDGETVALTPKGFEILLYMARNPGRSIPKEEFLEVIWSDVNVEEGNLARNVSSLRAALGEEPSEPRYIVTEFGCGYRFVAELEMDHEQTRSDPADRLLPAGRPSGRLRTALRFAAFVAGLAIAIGTAGAYVIGWVKATDLPIGLERLTFRHGYIGGARFAPDGQVVVYGASWDGEPYRLYTTRMGSGESRALDLPAADLLGVSPNADLAVVLGRPPMDGWEPLGLMGVVPLAGGSPRARLDGVVGVDWAPDGETMAIVRGVDGDLQLEFPQGQVIHRGFLIAQPRISRDGSRVCFIAPWGTLWVAGRDAAPRKLVEELYRARRCGWGPNDDEIWVEVAPGASTEMRLEAVDMSGARRVLHTFASLVLIQDVASDGRVLVSAGELRFSATGAAPGQEEVDLSAEAGSRVAHLGHDGRQVLLWDNSEGPRMGRTFLRNIDGSGLVLLGPGLPAALSPDGAWVALTENGGLLGLPESVLTLVPTGPGEARRIPLEITINHMSALPSGRIPWEFRGAGFSADGRRLLLPYGRSPGGEPRGWVVELDTGRVIPATPDGITGPMAFAHDGARVAVKEGDTLVVYDVDAGTRYEVPGGPEPGWPVRWHRGGESVLLLEQTGPVARVVRREIASGDRELLREVVAPDPASLRMFNVYVADDGGSYAYTTQRTATNLFVLTGLR